MTASSSSSEPSPADRASDAAEAGGSKLRLFLLVGLLALAVFALWYDYKVARPAVEQAYERITQVNTEINDASEHRRMTSVDVQAALDRTPSETFTSGEYTVEAYRWRAGMPIELRGLGGDESPGVGLKTHDYFAVYRKDGPELAFVTHFKFTLDEDELAEKPDVYDMSTEPPPEEATAGMGAPLGAMGAPGGPGGGGGGGFDPEAIFAERDVDGDGKLAGDEISERMRERVESMDTDGDGAISKDEFLARMREMRSRGGRGGGSGPEASTDNADGRRQRPPLEESNTSPAATPEPRNEAPADNADSAADDATPTSEPSTAEASTNQDKASPAANEPAATTDTGSDS